jgi:hypothetical protein
LAHPQGVAAIRPGEFGERASKLGKLSRESFFDTAKGVRRIMSFIDYLQVAKFKEIARAPYGEVLTMASSGQVESDRSKTLGVGAERSDAGLSQ